MLTENEIANEVDAPASPSRLALVGAGLVALMVVRVVADGTPIGDLAYLGAPVLGAVLAVVGAARHTGRLREGWGFVALALALSAAGDAVSFAIEVTTGRWPDVSLADLGWISCYVAFFYGLTKLLSDDDGHRDREPIIDGAVVLVVSLLVVWSVSIGPLLSDLTTAPWIRGLWAFYPVADAVLAALVVRAAVSRRIHPHACGLLAAGAATWFICDLGYSRLGNFTLALDLGWMVGSIVLGTAVWRVRPVPPKAISKADEVGRARLALAIAPVLGPAALALASALQGERANAFLQLGAAVALAGLAMVRAFRLFDEKAAAHAALEGGQRYWHALAENSADAVLVVDEHRRLVSESPQAARILGYEHEDRGVRSRVMRAVADTAAVDELFIALEDRPDEIAHAELELRHEDMRTTWVAVRMRNLLADPDVEGIVVNVHDITDRKQAEAELVHMALHDPLTGLANRRLFRDRVDHALQRAARTGVDPAVLFLDLDEFKQVNDTYGHDAGDTLLAEIAHRIEDAVRTGDTFARLGGDEFAVLVEPCEEPRVEAVSVARRILGVLSVPIPFEHTRLTVSCSIGIAVGDAISTAAGLLRDADVAMYQAKAAGKGRFAIFEPAPPSAPATTTWLYADRTA